LAVLGLNEYFDAALSVAKRLTLYYPGPGTEASTGGFSFKYTFLKYSRDMPKLKALDFIPVTLSKSPLRLYA